MVAAVVLVLTMLLPWYQQNGVVHGVVVSRDLNAFAVFSLIEGLVLLIALGVLALLFAVAERHTLPLPGIDGSLVLGGGSFAALLLVIRLFDKPGVSGKGGAVDVGVQWGIFFALAAAGLLVYAGVRMRASEREPPPLSGRRGWRGPSGSGPSPYGHDSPARKRAQRLRELDAPVEIIDAPSEIADVAAAANDPIETQPVTAEPIGARDARRRRAMPSRSRASSTRESEQLSFEDDITRP